MGNGTHDYNCVLKQGFLLGFSKSILLLYSRRKKKISLIFRIFWESTVPDTAGYSKKAPHILHITGYSTL